MRPQEEFNGHSVTLVTPDGVSIDAAYFPGGGMIHVCSSEAYMKLSGDAAQSGPTAIFFPANMQLFENPSSRQSVHPSDCDLS